MADSTRPGAAQAPAEPPRLSALGDAALLLTFGDGIEPGLNRRVHRFAALAEAARLPGLLDLVPAYATLAVHFDPLLWTWEELGAVLCDGIPPVEADLPPPRQVVLPVCYGGEAGPDLADLARHCGLTPEEVVARHTAAEYQVYFLGFTPGFPYLGGLDPALAAPRRATPRTQVPAGSVGIAGLQTGVYPLASPGGWQLLGRTPLPLFAPDREEPCWLRPGDRLRFEAISPERFQALAGTPA
jgi:KipI family sensor histidine kinase inhibitor